MCIKWWVPLVAIPLALVALVGVGAAVNPDVGARLKRTLRSVMPGSTLKMDDGVHKLYVAWNDGGVQDAAVDDKPVPTQQVTIGDGVVLMRGVTDAEGWPLYEEVAYSEDGTLRTLPGNSLERLGLRFAARPDPDGAWPVRAEARSFGREREPTQGAAQLAGLQPGDALLAVDGVRPATPAAMKAALESRHGDEAFPLVVRRGGAELELVVHPLALNGANFWVYAMQEHTRQQERSASASQDEAPR